MRHITHMPTLGLFFIFIVQGPIDIFCQPLHLACLERDVPTGDFFHRQRVPMGVERDVRVDRPLVFVPREKTNTCGIKTAG